MAYKIHLSTIVAATLLSCLLECAQVESTYDKELFKRIVRNDNSNDDAIFLSAPELLERSGFSYESYNSIADDGYITQLVRVINPRVRPQDLRKPPLLMFHGANTDMSSYLMASSIQHHPEAYPRLEERDGPITSSNRSLAFTLANNGYDVWLIGQRGSNQFNMGHLKDKERANKKLSTLKKVTLLRHLTVNDTNIPLTAFARTKQYWQYGLDDIIQYEIKNQIDLVLELTQSSQFSLFAFSLSTPTTLAFLALNPDYAQNVKVFLQMAPAIAASHFTQFDDFYFENFCPLLPTRGIGFTPSFVIKPAVRGLVRKLSASKKLRYSAIYLFARTLFGPSPIYQTNLERNVLSRTFQPVSFKSVQHYCQNSVSRTLTKFDYGKKANLARYGLEQPPAYDVSRIEVQNWVVISGTNDGLASPETVDRLVRTVSTPKPAERIIAPLFNHLDMVAAVEVDKYVNLPILEALNRLTSSE